MKVREKGHEVKPTKDNLTEIQGTRKEDKTGYPVIRGGYLKTK